MAESLLESVQDAFEGQIDFEGQRLAELCSNLILIIAGGIAFLYGYLRQEAQWTLYLGLGGSVIAFLVAVPPWPFFKQNPVKWLPKAPKPYKGPNIGGVEIEVDGKKIN